VGIAVDVEGMLWVADVENNRVQRLSPEGQYLGSFGVPLGESVDGAHVALGAQGVYLSDASRDRVVLYSFDGRPLASWGTRGARDGQFQRPVGIVVDPEGNVWVVERDGARVQRFRPPT
jgi:sugar lactone lactonase YvrE